MRFHGRSSLYHCCIAFLFSFSLCSVDANSMATLDGKSYISMEVNRVAMYSIREYIALQIKTRQSDAFLFYTGSKDTNLRMAVYLLDGRLRLIVHKGLQTYSPNQPISCPKGLYSKFDDNQWHAINVTWRKREITVEVDGTMMHRTEIQSEKMLSSRNVFVGGYRRDRLYDTVKGVPEKGLQFFKGCMRQVVYGPESIRFNLITKAREREQFFNTHGNIIFDKCQDYYAADPITFRTNDAFLKVRAKWRSTRNWNLYFSFRTTEEGGLMLYTKGNGSNADYLAFELRKSELYLLLNAGSGTKIYNAAFRNITDGKPHQVKLSYKRGKGDVYLDRRKTLSFDLTKNSGRNRGGFTEMNMNEQIFVGSLPKQEQILAPHELWSAKLRKGYVGCFWDLRVNRDTIDLVYETRRQLAEQDRIGLYCSSNKEYRHTDSCPNSPCEHGGVCKPGWDRFLCDCSNTMYTGYKCHLLAPVLRFNGAQSMMIRLPMEVQSEAEDVIIRFKTKEENGLLFGTHSPLSSAQDRMALFIQKGKLVLVLNFGKGNKTKPINGPISDNRWHTVSIHRRALQVTINLDGLQDIAFDINKQSSAKLINMRNIAVGYYKEPGHRFGNHFIGQMMHFTFNGINYFELANTVSPPNIELTADITNDETLRPYPVSFLTSRAYLVVQRKLEVRPGFTLRLWFKTARLNGILLYMVGRFNTRRSNYLLVEVVAGSLHFTYSVAGKLTRLSSNTGNLDNDLWHEMVVTLPKVRGRYNKFLFKVDGLPQRSQVKEQMTADSLDFTLNVVYIGGVTDAMESEGIYLSQMGYIGCIAALDLNEGRFTNPLSEAEQPRRKSLEERENAEVLPRCPGPGRQCDRSTCYYRGQCIQQWRRVRCNCELTSFTGPQCQQVSSTIKFGSGGGRVTLELLDRVRNTRQDEMAFGIQTKINEATLVHIVGQGKNQFSFDYIRIDILGSGYVQVSYNMGSLDFQVTETRIQVNDGHYHIVRVIREGTNTFLKVDENYERKIPKEPHRLSTHFNGQKWIYVGAPKPQNRRVERRSTDYTPYVGIISGMVFNGIPVTDLIAGKAYNPNIEIRRQGRISVVPDFLPNLNNFPPPLQNLTDSPSSSASTMQSTSSDKIKGSTNQPGGSIGIIAPHTDCRQNANCRVADTTDTAIVYPVVKYSSTPTLKQNGRPGSGATPTPSSSNVRPSQTRRPGSRGTPRPTAFPVGLGGLNVWLVVAIACGGALVLLLVVCIIYRCRHKADEGSYSVEHHQREFGGDPACKPLRRIPGEGEPLHMNGGATPLDSVPSAGDPSIGTFSRSDRSSTCSDRKKKKRKVKPSRKETREWYV